MKSDETRWHQTSDGREAVSLLAEQPHVGGAQLAAAGQPVPVEIVAEIAAVAVHRAVGAVTVPEAAAAQRRAVRGHHLVVVAVDRAELHAVLVAERVATGVALEAARRQAIVVRLRRHPERAVLGVVPVAVAARLHVETQLVAAAVGRQPTEQLVAEPVVAARVLEAGFELGPRTVERPASADGALDQQRNAVGCIRRTSRGSVSETRQWVAHRVFRPHARRTRLVLALTVV